MGITHYLKNQDEITNFVNNLYIINSWQQK